jgi:hypothetical protein
MLVTFQYLSHPPILQQQGCLSIYEKWMTSMNMYLPGQNLRINLANHFPHWQINDG